MKVTINRINDDYLLEAKGASDVPVYVDNKTTEEVKGVSPMELLLMSVGSCNAIDIIFILKKQRQQIASYRVEVEGHRNEVKEAKPFVAMDITVYLEGEINEAKARRAAELSFEKYCSATITIEKCVEVRYKVVVNGKEVV